MKRTIISLFIFISMLNVYSASNQFELKGKIKGITFGDAELSYWILSNGKYGEIKVKSSINQGNFLFKGYLKEPVEAVLKINDIEETLYIEPSIMKLYILKNQPDSFKLYGSKTHNEYMQLRIKTQKDDKLLQQNSDQLRLIDKQLDSLPENNPKYKELSDERESILCQRDSIFNSLTKITSNILQSNPNSFYPLLSNRCLVYISNGNLSVDTARIIFDKLSSKLKTSQIGLSFDNYLKMRENTAINKIAPDFSAVDMNGQVVRLSDYRGKSYVLLDFWGSWCLPCIQGLPNLKKIYEKYHKTGLQIIGLSSDRVKDQWISAINKHQIFIWPQVLTVQDIDKYNQGYINQEDIIQKYPTDGIPRYILIDKDGKIIGKWVGYSEENEKEMNDMLNGLLGK